MSDCTFCEYYSDPLMCDATPEGLDLQEIYDSGDCKVFKAKKVKPCMNSGCEHYYEKDNEGMNCMQFGSVCLPKECLRYTDAPPTIKLPEPLYVKRNGLVYLVKFFDFDRGRIKVGNKFFVLDDLSLTFIRYSSSRNGPWTAFTGKEIL